MHVGAMVEIQQNSAGDLPVTLLERAYTASTHTALALVVSRDLRAAVDRELDPIVPRCSLQIFGVRYVDMNDDAFIALARGATLVIASSPSLRERLAQSGVRFVDVDEGLVSLGALTQT